MDAPRCSTCGTPRTFAGYDKAGNEWWLYCRICARPFEGHPPEPPAKRPRVRKRPAVRREGAPA